MPSPDAPTIRVLIVDDHDILRYGVRALLRNYERIDVVGEADSKSQAIESVEALQPDVVLMDARLPDGSGIDACREILSRYPQIRVLFFSAYSDDQTVMMTLLAGAAGHVAKELEPASLVEAIHAVARGESVIDPRLKAEVLEVIEDSSRELKGEANALDRLSPQEERVMALVVQGKTNKEIAAALGLSDKTVKNYLRNVFQKMGVGRRAHAASLFDLQRLKRARQERLGALHAKLDPPEAAE
jgi:two-component system response regulator DevR